MKIFSVTALIFLTHSLSFTTGTWASRTRSGMGPAEKKNGFEMRKGEMQFHITVGKNSFIPKVVIKKSVIFIFDQRFRIEILLFLS